MPWQETLLMDQRVQFIADFQRGVFDVADLARRFGISRKTAYKWIDRYAADARPAWRIGHDGRLGVRIRRRRGSSRPSLTCGAIIRRGARRNC